MSQFQPISYTSKEVQKIHHMSNLLRKCCRTGFTLEYLTHFENIKKKKIKAKESNSLIGEELQADLSFSKAILLA